MTKSWEYQEGILYYHNLPYVSKIIRHKVISRHYSDPLVNYFRIKKAKDLVSRKYFWPSRRKDVKTYVKGCDVCLISKVVKYKLYKDLYSLPVPIHQWKDF